MPSLATDLSGKWESYRVFMAPVNWRFRSGDRLELNANPTGERLVEPFETADGVFIAPGHITGCGIGSKSGPRKSGACTRSSRGGSAISTMAIWTGFSGPSLGIPLRSSPSNSPASGMSAGCRPVTSRRRYSGIAFRLNISPDLSIAS